MDEQSTKWRCPERKHQYRFLCNQIFLGKCASSFRKCKYIHPPSQIDKPYIWLCGSKEIGATPDTSVPLEMNEAIEESFRNPYNSICGDQDYSVDFTDLSSCTFKGEPVIFRRLSTLSHQASNISNKKDKTFCTRWLWYWENKEYDWELLEKHNTLEEQYLLYKSHNMSNETIIQDYGKDKICDLAKMDMMNLQKSLTYKLRRRPQPLSIKNILQPNLPPKRRQSMGNQEPQQDTNNNMEINIYEVPIDGTNEYINRLAGTTPPNLHDATTTHKLHAANAIPSENEKYVLLLERVEEYKTNLSEEGPQHGKKKKKTKEDQLWIIVGQSIRSNNCDDLKYQLKQHYRKLQNVQKVLIERHGLTHGDVAKEFLKTNEKIKTEEEEDEDFFKRNPNHKIPKRTSSLDQSHTSNRLHRSQWNSGRPVPIPRPQPSRPRPRPRKTSQENDEEYVEMEIPANNVYQTRVKRTLSSPAAPITNNVAKSDGVLISQPIKPRPKPRPSQQQSSQFCSEDYINMQSDRGIVESDSNNPIVLRRTLSNPVPIPPTPASTPIHPDEIVEEKNNDGYIMIKTQRTKAPGSTNELKTNPVNCFVEREFVKPLGAVVENNENFNRSFSCPPLPKPRLTNRKNAMTKHQMEMLNNRRRSSAGVGVGRATKTIEEESTDSERIFGLVSKNDFRGMTSEVFTRHYNLLAHVHNEGLFEDGWNDNDSDYENLEMPDRDHDAKTHSRRKRPMMR